MRQGILYLFGFFGCMLYAQVPIIELDSIFVPDAMISHKSKTQSYTIIDKESIGRYSSDLTNVLRYQSPIYFKENGNGMVSSPSFRGTTAQQTAVVWNGININSKLLGQADFNAISTDAYDEIIIAPGGGSVVYGNGAIGGSVHLNNKIKFNKGLTAELQSKAGSFGYIGLNGSLGYSNQALNINLGYGYTEADNSYKLPSISYKNINGDYRRSSFYLNSAYQLNNTNRFSIFSEVYNDTRGFSLIEPTSNKTSYDNKNYRLLFQWENSFKNVSQKFSVAHLQEDYTYYEVRGSDPLSSGKVSTNVLKYTSISKFYKGKTLQLLGQISNAQAKGKGSGINKENRTDYNIATLLNLDFNQLFIQTGLRYEGSNQYVSPLLYSFGINYNIKNRHKIKFNLSKNFRSPTFNDLFWEPGGNKDLKSEDSFQFEAGGDFIINDFKVTSIFFYNHINDMIRWLPTNNNYWEPQNTDEVITKGIELKASYKRQFNWLDLDFNINVAYTEAKNRKKNIPLSFVPKFIFNNTLKFGYRNTSFVLSSIINDQITTKESVETPEKLKPWAVLNLGLYQKIKYLNLELGLKVNNLSNEVYAIVPYRPMPPRNIMFNINYKL